MPKTPKPPRASIVLLLAHDQDSECDQCRDKAVKHGIEKAQSPKANSHHRPKGNEHGQENATDTVAHDERQRPPPRPAVTDLILEVLDVHGRQDDHAHEKNPAVPLGADGISRAGGELQRRPVREAVRCGEDDLPQGARAALQLVVVVAEHLDQETLGPYAETVVQTQGRGRQAQKEMARLVRRDQARRDGPPGLVGRVLARGLGGPLVGEGEEEGVVQKEEEDPGRSLEHVGQMRWWSVEELRARQGACETKKRVGHDEGEDVALDEEPGYASGLKQLSGERHRPRVIVTMVIIGRSRHRADQGDLFFGR